MNLHVRAIWTDTRITMLRELIADKLTAAMIAEKIGGISKNSVIGKANRLGLQFAHNRSRPPHPNGQAPRRRPHRTNEPHLALTKERVQIVSVNLRRSNGTRKPVEVVECETLDLPPDQSDFACTIHELGSVDTMHRCRWPLGQPAHDMPYCGAEHDGPGPYCVRHHLLAYRAAPRR